MVRGIVLTNGSPSAGMVFHMALVVENNYKTVRQFKLIAVSSTKTKIKTEYSDGIRTTTTCEIETPLIYGYTLEWRERDDQGRPVEFVNNFTRVRDTYESRICDGQTQLLLHGVMSRNRKVLWMCDMWPDLEIPYRIQHTIHPNVVVFAWVTLQIKPDQSLRYELHSFERVADAFQFAVKDAAWNRGDEGNIPWLYDPLENKSDAEYVAPIADAVTGMQGYVISDKIVLVSGPKFRDICFHRIVIREGDRYPEIGSPVQFKAEKLDYLNIYALQEITPRPGQMLPVVNGMVKTNIRKQHDLPGFYFSESLQCFLDDPENILEAWLLSQYNESSLQVLITAAEPSIRGTPRFAIAEIVDKRAAKIKEFRRSEQMRFEGKEGVVISLSGRIHVSDLPKSIFRLPEGQCEHYPPGTRLLVTARRGPRAWIVEAVEVNYRNPTVRAVTVFNEKTQVETVWFQVPQARGCAELPFLLKAPIFGLIQTPRRFRIRINSAHFVYKDIWITLNDCHSGELIKPQAKFKYVAIDNIESISKPIPAVVIQSTTPDYPDLDSDLGDEESLTVEGALNDADVPRVYRAIQEEEFQRHQQQYKGITVHEMLERLRKSNEFRNRPVECINDEIKAHLATCTACKNNQFSVDCYFNEYLAQVLERNPYIVEHLKHDVVQMIAVRRYEQ